MIAFCAYNAVSSSSPSLLSLSFCLNPTDIVILYHDRGSWICIIAHSQVSYTLFGKFALSYLMICISYQLLMSIMLKMFLGNQLSISKTFTIFFELNCAHSFYVKRRVEERRREDVERVISQPQCLSLTWVGLYLDSTVISTSSHEDDKFFHEIL